MEALCKGTLLLLKNVFKTDIGIKRTMLKNSINHILSKKVMDRYMRLPLPCNKVLATYVWIDCTGTDLRSKDRVLNCVPYNAEVAPDWEFGGRSCGLATTDQLKPVAVCRDPFRCEPHVLILTEVYEGDRDGIPAPTNYRKYCNALMEKWVNEEIWFGFHQQCTFIDVDGWGLGWPKGGGFPFVKYEFCYCGVGAKYVAGRDIVDSHARACLYAGLNFEGTNAEVMFGCWEYKIGLTAGISSADDLWLARYIMGRVGEDYGTHITYHPKPFGRKHPGVTLHHVFSTKRMREDGGFEYIKQCINKLEKNFVKHMKAYGSDEATDKMRSLGVFETAQSDKFPNRKSSVAGEGFMEDKSPSGNCDPYRVCGSLIETCLEETEQIK